MIPKVIHFCWFGPNEIPKEFQRYIETWKEKMPDYNIIKWSEDTYDISNSLKYVKEAYQRGKYAFVSDYVRLKALYDFGGIYFDTDVEVLQNFENLLEGYNLVLGLEKEGSISAAIIGASPQNKIIGELLESYSQRRFITKTGENELKTINACLAKVLNNSGIGIVCCDRTIMGNRIRIYDSDIFSAFDMKHWHEKTTEKSVTVHHMYNSWAERKKTKYYIRDGLRKIIGIEMVDRIQDFIQCRKGKI